MTMAKMPSLSASILFLPISKITTTSRYRRFHHEVHEGENSLAKTQRRQDSEFLFAFFAVFAWFARKIFFVFLVPFIVKNHCICFDADRQRWADAIPAVGR